MNKALKILSVLFIVVLIAALPLFSSFAYDYTYEKIYSDELSFNTNYHIETYNSSGVKKLDYNGPINAHVPTFYYADGTTSLPGGVLHTDLFTYLDQNEFDTFQWGYTPNNPLDMYRGLIGHGFRFTNVIPRFEQYYDPNFELVSVTFSFQAVFYVESVGLNSSPDFTFRFYSNNALGVKLTPTYTRPFNNSYDGTGFLASFDVNFLVSDFEAFINDFIGISFAWDKLVGSDTSHGNNQVFVYAFNVMNVTIESGDITLDNVNQSIINGNNIQHQINNKLDYIQNDLQNFIGAIGGSGSVSNPGNIIDVDYDSANALDNYFSDSFTDFNDSFTDFFNDSLTNNSNIAAAFSLYSQVLSLGFIQLPFLNAIFSVILLFMLTSLILGLSGISHASRRSERYERMHQSDFKD